MKIYWWILIAVLIIVGIWQWPTIQSWFSGPSIPSTKKATVPNNVPNTAQTQTGSGS